MLLLVVVGGLEGREGGWKVELYGGGGEEERREGGRGPPCGETRREDVQRQT